MQYVLSKLLPSPHREHGRNLASFQVQRHGGKSDDRTGVLFNLDSLGCSHSCHLFTPNAKLLKIKWLLRELLDNVHKVLIRALVGTTFVMLTGVQIVNFQREALNAEKHTE